MNDSPLAGRVVVVTGAARGIGAALARELSARGARLALLDHDGPELRATAAALPGPALAVQADVTDMAELEEAAATVRAELRRPSVVVANAGIAEGGPFEASDAAVWRRVIDVNLTGSAQTARAFLPDLAATKGYFLQIASLAALGAVPMMSAYCASKSGVEAFTQSLRHETAARGVAVGIAYLNWVDTGLIREADRTAVLHTLRTRMPPPARHVLPLELVAARLARAVERRRPAVHVPRWVRLVQVARGVLPPFLTLASRRELPRLESREGALTATGLLGDGGRADGAAAGLNGR